MNLTRRNLEERGKMTDQEWIEWLEDIKFNLEFIPVRVKVGETWENKRLSELTMKEGMKFILQWARGQKKKDESV